MSLPCQPFSSARYIGAVAVPYLAVASVPALQWVRMPISRPGRLSSRSRPKPISPMPRLMATSCCWMASARANRLSFSAGSGSARPALTASSMRSSAQNRLTAVGREEARYFLYSMNRA